MSTKPKALHRTTRIIRSVPENDGFDDFPEGFASFFDLEDEVVEFDEMASAPFRGKEELRPGKH